MLALALFKPMLEKLGYSKQQRQQLVKGLLGTHAHEMTSVTQQMLVKFDEEAGRRCGLNVSIPSPECLRCLSAMRVVDAPHTSTTHPAPADRQAIDLLTDIPASDACW